MKLREFMPLGQQAWADMATDAQLPFIERYKVFLRDH